MFGLVKSHDFYYTMSSSNGQKIKLDKRTREYVRLGGLAGFKGQDKGRKNKILTKVEEISMVTVL